MSSGGKLARNPEAAEPKNPEATHALDESGVAWQAARGALG